MSRREPSREERRERRRAEIEAAWEECYFELLTGELTPAELLGHDDRKLLQIAELCLRLLKLGRVEAARRIGEGLVLLDPFVPYFHVLLGTVYEKLGCLEEALAEADEAAELCRSIDPPLDFLAQVLLFRGKLLIRLGKPESAREALCSVNRREIPDVEEWELGEARVLLDRLDAGLPPAREDLPAAPPSEDRQRPPLWQPSPMDRWMAQIGSTATLHR